MKKEQIENLQVSCRQLCDITGLTATRIAQLAEGDVMVRVKRGKYAFWPSVKNYIAMLQKEMASRSPNSRKSTSQEASEQEQLKTRTMRAKAEDAELSLQLRKGELNRSEDVAAIWSDNVANAKSRLLAIPSKLAPMVQGVERLPELQDIIDGEIRQALDELANYDQSAFIKELIAEDGAPLEKPAENDD